MNNDFTVSILCTATLNIMSIYFDIYPIHKVLLYPFPFELRYTFNNTQNKSADTTDVSVEIKNFIKIIFTQKN